MVFTNYENLKAFLETKNLSEFQRLMKNAENAVTLQEILDSQIEIKKHLLKKEG